MGFKHFMLMNLIRKCTINSQEKYLKLRCTLGETENNVKGNGVWKTFWHSWQGKKA